MGCNLTCSWALPGGGRSPCDESQTWDATRFDLTSQGTRMAAGSIAAMALAPLGPDPSRGLVVVTGGEPLLHSSQPGWLELFDALGTAGARVEVETNGTIIPVRGGHWAASQYNVSPKLASSGVAEEKRINPAALTWFRNCGRAVFKIVCATTEDVKEADGLAERFEIPPDLMWIMPAGVTPEEVLSGARALAPAVAALGFNLTLRQQWLVHGPEGEPRT